MIGNYLRYSLITYVYMRIVRINLMTCVQSQLISQLQTVLHNKEKRKFRIHVYKYKIELRMWRPHGSRL